MINKNIKISLVVLMILGIAFSISNFMPKKSNASSIRGMWIDGECQYIGNECDIELSDLPTTFVSSHPAIEIKPKGQIIQKETKFKLNINSPEKIEFSPKSELPQLPGAFCVTEDKLFIISDQEAGNIKIYKLNKKSLNLVDIIGRKGYGSDEFAKPAYCFYNEAESKFVVMDKWKNKIFIFDRIGKLEFKRVKDIYCVYGGNSAQLSGNKLFVSGYSPGKNKEPYDLYYIDILNDQPTLLLPSYYKYGFKSLSDFEKKFEVNNVPSIGIRGFFNIQGDDVFFAWEGNSKIIKLSIESRELVFFGKKPFHYIKPYPSEKLIKFRRTNNRDIIKKEKAKMSYVRNVFTSPKYVLIIFEGPINYRLQFYTLGGYFIKEISIAGQPDCKMWLDKDKDILYSLSSISEESRRYYILKHEFKL